MRTGLCEGFRAGHGHVHLISVMVEQVLQPERNIRIVVDDEDGMSQCCRCHRILPRVVGPILKPQRQPAHDASGDEVTQRVFLVFVIERIEDRESYLCIAHIAGRGFLLPEPIPGAEVEQVVAADVILRWSDSGCGKIRQGRETLCDRIGGGPDIVVTDLSAEAVFPFRSQPGADFRAGAPRLTVPLND